MNKKIAFISDFDGTISHEDFFDSVADKYLNEEALAPWKEYLAGNITHLNALNQIFAKIRVPETELVEFIKTIKFDKKFFDTIELCRQNNIPIYICSAGTDYYILKMIGDKIKEYNITVVTNHGIYSEDEGLRLVPPQENSPYYDEKVGISKAAIVKQKQEEGYFVVYAGDGPPDFAAAQIADVVFARKILLQKCIEAGIKTERFDSFDNVSDCIKDLVK